MIFNKEYDDSLWLMLENKNISKAVRYILKDFPQELLIQIRESLRIYNETLDKNNLMEDWEMYKKYFTGEYINTNGVIYRYCVNICGGLEIGDGLLREDKIVNLCYMSLYPLNSNDLLEGKVNLLGSLSEGYDYSDAFFYVSPDMSTNVYLSKNILNVRLLRVKGFLTKSKLKYNFIELDRIPDSYMVSDMESKDVKRLLRKKKI